MAKPYRVANKLIEKLRNENEDKTKTQMTQSFNQYSENETEIWRQNILNQLNRVSSSCLRSHFVISLTARLRNHNATDDDNVDFKSFTKILYSKLGR